MDTSTPDASRSDPVRTHPTYGHTHRTAPTVVVETKSAMSNRPQTVRTGAGVGAGAARVAARAGGGSGGSATNKRHKSHSRPSELKPTDGEYQEYYDNASLVEALKVLTTTQVARERRIDDLDRYVKDNPLAKDAPNDPPRLLLKRLRRVQECQRWCEDLERVSHAPDARGRRRRTVRYARKELKVSKLAWGRRYAKCDATVWDATHRVAKSVALQQAPREVRLGLCSVIYEDVDMVNSFIRIAICKAKTYGMTPPLEMLEKYGSDDAVRETMLETIMEHHKIYDRTDAKRLLLVLLHGGSYAKWLNDMRPPVCERLEWVKDFSKDVSRLLAEMLVCPDGIEAAVVMERSVLIKEKKRESFAPNGGIAEVDRTIFANIMQSYEDRLLCIVIDSLKSKGWTIGSLQFDGLYVEPREGLCLEAAMRFAEDEVLRQTGGEFNVSLKRKELYGMPTSTVLSEWRTAHLAHVGV